MDPRLRLQASVDDQATSKIKAIAAELAKVKRTPQMEQTTKWFGDVEKGAREVSRGFSEVGGAFSSIGLGSVAAAASVGGLVKSFVDLSSRIADVKELGRQAGLTVNQVKQFEYVGEKFSVSTDKMDAALGSFGDKMFEFRRGAGDLFKDLSSFEPELANRMRFETPKKAVEDFLHFLTTVKHPVNQAHWAEEAFGTGDIARLAANGADELNKALEDAAKNAPKITPELEQQAKLLHDSIVEFDQSWQKFETDIGPTVFKELKQAADDFGAAFKEITTSIDWLKAHPVSDWMKAADQKFDDHTKDAHDRYVGDKPWGIGIPKEWTDSLGLTDPKKPWDENSPYWFGLRSNSGTRSNAPATAPAPPAPSDTSGSYILPRTGHSRGDSYYLPYNPGSRMYEGAPDDSDTPKSNSLRHNSAFVTSNDSGSSLGGTGLVIDAVSTGTKSGVLAAFREWAAQSEAERQGEGLGGGIQNAAYTVGGSGGGGRIPTSAFPQPDGGGGNAPAGILDMIRKGETGSLGPESWKSITGQYHGDFRPDVTKMTIDQVLAFQKQMREQGVSDSAVGGFQINGATLQDFKSRMGLSGSETFDQDMQTRIAKQIYASTGGNIGALRGRWMSLRKQSDAAIGAAQSASNGAGYAGTGDAVAIAQGLSRLGANAQQAANALHSRMTPGEWCADFVNGVIKGAGGKGVNSSMAAAFAHWGNAVGINDAKRGDVILENAHGNKINHVGLATGRVQRDASGHVTAVEMVSGNYGDRVKTNWERPGIIAGMRRGIEGEHHEAPPPREPRPSLLDKADKAGLGPTSIRHEGGATIDIRGLPSAKSTRIKTSGMIQAVNIRRAPSMSTAAEMA